MSPSLLACVLLVFGAAFLALGQAPPRGPRAAVGRHVDRTVRDMVRWARHLPAVARARADAERRRRSALVLRQLPTMLDVLTLGLSSGLSFDASLELYCDRYGTELACALREAMLTWRMGMRSRDDALIELAADLDVAALRRFAVAVGQALAFGAPLATTLELQAQVIRDEQRADMEAQIERAPVRMLIPLGTLIVPAMLLSILGPLLGSTVVAL